MTHNPAPGFSLRLRRCLLSTPASSPRMMAKALDSDADAVFLDLEDAVAPSAKIEARRHAIEALRGLDWRGAGKSISVRVNGLDTDWTYQDIIAVVEGAGAYIDTLIIPKLGGRDDLYAVDAMVCQLCRASGVERNIRLEGLIESAAGVMNVAAIAGYNRYVGTERLEALHFGAGDYAASIGAPTISIGGSVHDYPGDIWHYPLSAMVAACRANGIVPMDSAYGDFSDSEGYLTIARRARALGMAGKWAIHPSQIALANEVFSPTGAELAQAQALIDALAASEASGSGAAEFEGRMIDAASTRMAQNIVALGRRLAERKKPDKSSTAPERRAGKEEQGKE